MLSLSIYQFSSIVCLIFSVIWFTFSFVKSSSGQSTKESNELILPMDQIKVGSKIYKEIVKDRMYEDKNGNIGIGKTNNSIRFTGVRVGSGPLFTDVFNVHDQDGDIFSVMENGDVLLEGKKVGTSFRLVNALSNYSSRLKENDN